MIAAKRTYLFVTCLILLVSQLACTPNEAESPALKESILHLSNAVEYENKATAIINKGGAYSTMPIEDSEQIIEYLKKTLEEASMVNTELLNSQYPSWGDKYKNDYIEGLKLIIKGHETANAAISIEGQRKTASYKNWFSQIRKNM